MYTPCGSVWHAESASLARPRHAQLHSESHTRLELADDGGSNAHRLAAALSCSLRRVQSTPPRPSHRCCRLYAPQGHFYADISHQADVAGVTRTDWRQLSAARSDVCRAPHRGHLTAAVVSLLPKVTSCRHLPSGIQHSPQRVQSARRHRDWRGLDTCRYSGP